MKTAIYQQPRTFEKYDNEHFLLYLNETEADFVPQGGDDEQPLDSVPGYQYSGDQENGSTIIEATDATYGDFINGLVRKTYSQSDVEALQANMIVALSNPQHPRAEEFNLKWEEFTTYRDNVKVEVKRMLEM